MNNLLLYFFFFKDSVLAKSVGITCHQELFNFGGENVNYKPNTVLAIKKKKFMLDCLLQAFWFTVCIFSWIGLYPL